MRLRITGKQAVRQIGCAFFCLIVCGLAFWNRSLVIEPVTSLLRGESNFVVIKDAVQRNYLDDRFRGKNELLTLNGGFARLQGRTRYNGVQTLTNGMLTSTETEMKDMTALADNLVRFQHFLEEQDIPFLFVMTPDKKPLAENVLPTGITDVTNEIVDQLLEKLSENGVPFLDLRLEMSRTAEQVERYFYRTDHHWNAEGAFLAYQRIMGEIQNLDPETKTNLIDFSLWEKHVLPRWWLGSQGRRVGPLYGGTDDLDYYLPLFETAMSRYSPGVCAYKGDFRQVCMEESLLEHSDYMKMDSYHRYLGGGYPLACHRNTQAENQRKLLLIRDSFMVPVECFLSTEFTSIDVIDPRGYGEMSEAEYVLLHQPDMVIAMISPSVLPSGYYDFYTDFGGEPGLELIQETRYEEIAASGASGETKYVVLPSPLEEGRSYILTLEQIRIREGTPDFVSIRLFDGDQELQEIVFDIEYGNQFEFRWGFHLPETGENGHHYHLRLYAGIGHGTEGVELVYQGVRLREYMVKNHLIRD